MSFQNLTTIEGSRYDELMNLVTLSTTASLVKLIRMFVIDCKRIEKIIEPGQTRDEEGSYCYQSLKYWNFAVWHTPYLQRLQLSDEDEDQCWEGNLNDTTQRLFKDMDFPQDK